MLGEQPDLLPEARLDRLLVEVPVRVVLVALADARSHQKSVIGLLRNLLGDLDRRRVDLVSIIGPVRTLPEDVLLGRVGEGLDDVGAGANVFAVELTN